MKRFGTVLFYTFLLLSIAYLILYDILYDNYLKYIIPKSEIDYTYSGIIGLSCLVLLIIFSLVRLHQIKVRKTEVNNENI